jgi:hypothetical protein
MKGERIEQVNQHQILGLIFDARMMWNEHILYENILKYLGHTKWGADQQNLIRINQMVLLSTIRDGEEAYGSASQAISGNLNQLRTEE